MVFYSFGLVSLIVLLICICFIPNSVNKVINYDDYKIENLVAQSEIDKA